MRQLLFILFLLGNSLLTFSQNKNAFVLLPKEDTLILNKGVNLKYTMQNFSLREEDKAIAIYHFYHTRKIPVEFYEMKENKIFTGWLPTGLFILRQLYLTGKGEQTLFNMERSNIY
jgi:hypothetical protein